MQHTRAEARIVSAEAHTAAAALAEKPVGLAEVHIVVALTPAGLLAELEGVRPAEQLAGLEPLQLPERVARHPRGAR
jgi:hypothetical protein